MKASEAKKIVADLLQKHGIGYEKLRAKTVGFQDLARDSAVFVTPVGLCLPEPRLRAVQSDLRAHKGVILSI